MLDVVPIYDINGELIHKSLFENAHNHLKILLFLVKKSVTVLINNFTTEPKANFFGPHNTTRIILTLLQFTKS